jgi:hypothetical protein
MADAAPSITVECMGWTTVWNIPALVHRIKMCFVRKGCKVYQYPYTFILTKIFY